MSTEYHFWKSEFCWQERQIGNNIVNYPPFLTKALTHVAISSGRFKAHCLHEIKLYRSVILHEIEAEIKFSSRDSFQKMRWNAQMSLEKLRRTTENSLEKMQRATLTYYKSGRFNHLSQKLKCCSRKSRHGGVEKD